MEISATTLPQSLLEARLLLLDAMRSEFRAKSWNDELKPPAAVLVTFAIALERDDYARGRSDRVARLAHRLGVAAGLSEQQRDALHRAGQLRDIGSVRIPGDRFRKGRHTREELAMARKHPVISYEICKPLKSLANVLSLVRGHHERLDGSGYPDGLKGDQISRSLHCLIVADYYDALTTARPDRRALSDAEAIAILRADVARGRLDAATVELLSECEKTAVLSSVH